MKKQIVFIAWMLLAVMMIVPVMAAGSVQVSAGTDQTTLQRGEEITVTVAAEVDSCKSGGVEVSYDTAMFELVSGQWLLNGAFMSDFDVSAKDGVFAFAASTPLTGDVFRFVLKVKDSAELKSTTVTVKFIADSKTASDDVSLTVACQHTYGEGVVTKKATCTEDGTRTYTCTACGDVRTESVKATGHSYDDGKVTTKPTCTQGGVKTYSCKNCEATRKETVEATGHSYDDGKVTKQPGCTEKGEKTYTCSACGTARTESIKATGHNYDSGKVTQESSCTQEGIRTYTCENCGETKTETLQKTAHSYDHACDTTCNECGAHRETEHTYSERWKSNAEGHWYECTVCGDVLEMLPHNPGPEPTEQTDQICLECGYILQPAAAHTHSPHGDWLSDGTSHWHECACGEIVDMGDHSWDAGVTGKEHILYTCTVCGVTKTAPLPVDPPPTDPVQTPPNQPDDPAQTPPQQGGDSDPRPGDPGEPDADFPWWILLVIAGVLILGGILFVIIGILTSRKQVGKYSSK